MNPPSSDPIQVSSGKWWVYLVLMAAYPLLLGILPAYLRDGERGPLLPRGTGALLAAIGVELAVFSVVFGAAWLITRPTRGDLLLVWKEGATPVWKGLLYSILLRVVLAGFLAAAILAASLGGGMKDAIERIRPRTEAVVDPGVLVQDPFYFILTLTVVSFVLGGLREELWRAGMLAGFRALQPRSWSLRLTEVLGITLAAVVFGLGHLPQGWGGSVMTGLLGLGLGWIMIFHRSIWESVLAHGFFNATSFAMLFALESFQLKP